MTFRLLAAALLAFALAASPASAAGTLAPLDPCYVSAGRSTEQLEDIVVAGEGFSPIWTVEVLIDGVVVETAPTGSIGEFSRVVDAPYRERGERAFTLTVQDAGNPATAVSTQSRVTNLAVSMRPRKAAPNRRVSYRGRGFTEPAPVFAHYLYGGREQRTVRFARHATGPCGTFDVRRRQIPVDGARTGRWLVQVDQKRAYAAEPDPVWVRLPITVVEVFLEP
ncbi:MAG TPA: hypothetical protein VNO82_16990 [Solirubrobacteraceae bacterium]|nr:hypothetical protein [Solirubrobacteraceae bacterium]